MLSKQFKIIFWFLRPYKLRVILIFLFLFIFTILETVSIGAFYPLLNNLLSIDGEQINTGGRVLGVITFIVRQLPISEEIIAASVFLLILVVGSALFGLFAESFATWYRYKLFADFLNKVYYKFLNNHYRFFLEKKQGDLMYIGMEASQSVGEMLLYFPKVGVEFFRLVAISVFLLTISFKITIAVFAVMLLFGLVIQLLSVKAVHPVVVGLQKSQSELTAVFSESIAGIKQIKIFDNLVFWYNRFKTHTHKSRMCLTTNVVLGYIPSRLVLVVGVFSICISIIYFKLYKPEQFTTALPIIAIYVLALQRLMPSISRIGHYWMGLKGLSPRLELTYKTLTDMEYTAIEDKKKHFTGLSNEIKLENVSFSFPAKEKVLNNVNINITKGQTIAIVGESGAGKSTLADLLISIYHPTSGKILVDGGDYIDFSLSSWLGHIGMVTQDTFIFHASVKENIRMGKPDATDEEIINAATSAHAHQFIMELPEEYNTYVGDRGIKLSGGQRQRIAIARAVIRNPDILILDEATSSLDNISEKIVQDALREVKQNKTTIIIAHRLSSLEHADKIVVMKNGEIREDGTHDELLNRQGYYYELYQKQKNV